MKEYLETPRYIFLFLFLKLKTLKQPSGNFLRQITRTRYRRQVVTDHIIRSFGPRHAKKDTVKRHYVFVCVVIFKFQFTLFELKFE